MALLDKKALKEQLGGFKTEVVPVPEWGGELLVRELTTTEVMQIGSSAVDPETGAVKDGAIPLEEMAAAFPIIVAHAVVDENMNPLFTAAEVNALPARYLDVVQRLGMKALELTGLVEDDEDAPESKN